MNLKSLNLYVGSFPVYSSQSVGSILGGEILTINGPTFNQNDNITCIFGKIETEGVYLTEQQCLCVVPQAENDGLVNLNIKIRRGAAILIGRTKFRYGTCYIIYI